MSAVDFGCLVAVIVVVAVIKKNEFRSDFIGNMFIVVPLSSEFSRLMHKMSHFR